MDFTWLEVYLIVKGDAIRGTMNTIFWITLIISIITYIIGAAYFKIFDENVNPNEDDRVLGRKFIIAANKMIMMCIFFLVFRIIFPNSSDIASMMGLKAIDDGQFLLENRYTAGILKDKFENLVVEPSKSDYMNYANTLVDSLNSELEVKDSLNSILMLRLQMENVNLDSILTDVQKYVEEID